MFLKEIIGPQTGMENKIMLNLTKEEIETKIKKRPAIVKVFNSKYKIGDRVTPVLYNNYYVGSKYWQYVKLSYGIQIRPESLKGKSATIFDILTDQHYLIKFDDKTRSNRHTEDYTWSFLENELKELK